MAKHPENVRMKATMYAVKERDRINRVAQDEENRRVEFHKTVGIAEGMVLDELSGFVEYGFSLREFSLYNSAGEEIGSLQVKADLESCIGPIIFEWWVQESGLQIKKGSKGTDFAIVVREFGTAMGRWLR